ncbi:MAG: tRNA lysidine(34) synthetase TilS [Spirochaetes bacterium]|nr:MAG: tRNA lysidine(34) synthetase TilS [Spirochaetota bacterium]
MSSPLYDRIHDFIRARALLETGDRVLVCASAGKDSMALLDVLLALRERCAIGLGIFHVNHGVRGAESDTDESHVRERAKGEGIEAHVVRMGPFPGGGISFEDYAREFRYREAGRIAGEHGYSKIATAHSMDDQAETLLMRIFFGTGIHGLCGIASRRGKIVRPLLCVSAQEIYAHLEQRAIRWREDATNADTAYFRNFVRHEILGRVRERLPEVSRALAELGDRARENEGMLRGLIDERFGPIRFRADGASYIRLAPVAGKEAVLRWTLAAVIREDFAEFVHGGMLAEICRNLGSEKTHGSLYRSDAISVQKTVFDGEPVIRIDRVAGREEKGREWEYLVPLTDTPVTVEIRETGAVVLIEPADEARYTATRGETGSIFIALPDEIRYISIRNRRPGDRVRLEFGNKKVKDLYIENKLDTVRKNDIPLIIAGGRIAGILPGRKSGLRERVSSDFFVHPGSKRILALSVQN